MVFSYTEQLRTLFVLFLDFISTNVTFFKNDLHVKSRNVENHEIRGPKYNLKDLSKLTLHIFASDLVGLINKFMLYL